MAATSDHEADIPELAAFPEGCGDCEATDFKDCAEKLCIRVRSCCKKGFGMGENAVKLVMRNIPTRLDLENQSDHGGCVEIELTVTNILEGSDNGETGSKGWTVTVDVDGPSPVPRPQRAHYGYTIDPTFGGGSKTTGHIFLPEGVTPPYYRPWKGSGESKGQVVHFADVQGKFILEGKRFNQCRKE